MKKIKDLGGNRADFVLSQVNRENLPVESVLDIGCSHGSGLNALTGKAHNLTGIDMDKEALHKAEANYPHIKFIHQDANTLPFDSNSFDIVILSEVIEHVGDENKQLVIDEAHRVLKAGGLFILTCPYAGIFAWTDPMDFKRRFPFVYRFYMRLTGYKPHTPVEVGHKHLSFKELKTLFAHRFEINHVRYCGFLTSSLTGVLAVDSRLHLLPTDLHQALNRFRGWESGVQCGQPFAFNIRLAARKKSGT